MYKRQDWSQALVFTKTKHGANKLTKHLEGQGIVAAAIHGNKSQGARTRALAGFKDGSIPILVATDIASRGIDVDGVTHVFNYDLPNEPESYVHRIGRTARMKNIGSATSFVTSEDFRSLQAIERLLGYAVPCAPGSQPLLRPRSSKPKSGYLSRDESSSHRKAKQVFHKSANNRTVQSGRPVSR